MRPRRSTASRTALRAPSFSRPFSIERPYQLAPVALAVPAEVEAHRRERRRLGVLEREAEARAQLRLHEVQRRGGGSCTSSAPACDPCGRRSPSGGSRWRATASTTCSRADAAEVEAEERRGARVVVRHAEPAAAVEIEAAAVAAPVRRDGHEAHVLGQHVDRVVVRVGDADLELARQVLLAVDGLARVQRGAELALVVAEEGLEVAARSSARARRRSPPRAHGARGSWRGSRSSIGDVITLRFTSPQAPRRGLAPVVAVQVAHQGRERSARRRGGTGCPGAR